MIKKMEKIILVGINMFFFKYGVSDCKFVWLEIDMVILIGVKTNFLPFWVPLDDN